jgi:predicted DNA-binding protein YlxM (UPF0122 family)
MSEKPKLTEDTIRLHLTTIYRGLQEIHQRIDEAEITRDALIETLRDEKPKLLREYEAKLEALKSDAENTRGALQMHDLIQTNIDLLEGKSK